MYYEGDVVVARVAARAFVGLNELFCCICVCIDCLFVCVLCLCVLMMMCLWCVLELLSVGVLCVCVMIKLCLKMSVCFCLIFC